MLLGRLPLARGQPDPVGHLLEALQLGQCAHQLGTIGPGLAGALLQEEGPDAQRGGQGRPASHRDHLVEEHRTMGLLENQPGPSQQKRIAQPERGEDPTPRLCVHGRFTHRRQD